MKEKYITLVSAIITILSILGFYLGLHQPITLWVYLISAIIFYSFMTINSFLIAKQRPNISASIHNAFVLLITQILLFAILMYVYLALLSGISPSGILQLFSNASIYVSCFGLFSIYNIYKAQPNFSVIKFKITFYNILLIYCVLIIFFILINLLLIFCDIKSTSQPTILWLVSYWLAVFLTPVILSISNTFDKIIANNHI